MLPLQHLLMSERARHLTALEVKAIVFKVGPCSHLFVRAACLRVGPHAHPRWRLATEAVCLPRIALPTCEQLSFSACLTMQPTPRTSLLLPSHPFRTPQVAADLASLHDAGVLHRHVTIASVALARTGNLATARLMGHPYNVEAGQT